MYCTEEDLRNCFAVFHVFTILHLKWTANSFVFSRIIDSKVNLMGIVTNTIVRQEVNNSYRIINGAQRKQRGCSGEFDEIGRDTGRMIVYDLEEPVTYGGSVYRHSLDVWDASNLLVKFEFRILHIAI